MKREKAALAVLLLAAISARAQEQVPQLVIGTGHSLVRRVAFSAGDELLATGSADGTVKLWDLQPLRWKLPGQELRTINAGIGSVETLTFSGDGRRLATATLGEMYVRVWDTATGARVLKVAGYRLVALDAHGTQVATVDLGSPSRVVVWVEQGSIRKLDTQLTSVTALRFAPNGLLIVSGPEETAIWNVATGQRVRTFPGRLIGTNADASLIGLSGKEVVIARVDRDEVVGHLPAGAQKLAILDEKRMITVACGRRESKSPRTVIRSWNGWAQTSERDHDGCFGDLGAIELSPGGTLMSWGPIDADRIEDVVTGNQVFSLLGNVSGVTTAAFVGGSHDLSLLTSGFDGAVTLWKMGKRKVHELRPPPGPAGARLTVAARSPDGRYDVIADARGGAVQLRDSSEAGESRTLAPSRYALSSVNFSADGRYVAVGTFGTVYTNGESNDALTIYELPAGSEIRRFEGRSSADFQNGGTQVAISGMDREVILWDLATKQELPHAVEMHGRTLFSPDGRKLVSRTERNTLQLWEPSGGSPRFLQSEQPWDFRPQVYAFSPDSKYLAAAGEQSDHTYAITIWEVASATPRAKFLAHRGSVMSLSFSPDSRLLASASMDRTVKLWAIPTGQERATLVSANGGQWVVSTPEGRWDALDEGRSGLLHWVVGNESIGLDQLQERYYEPGLLGKIAGVIPDPLQEVEALSAFELFPVISEATFRPDGTLTVGLRNRNGGVGTVNVFVNRVECRREEPGAKGGPSTTITIPVANCPQIRPGEMNDVKVVATNEKGNGRTRETLLQYIAPGEKVVRPRKLYAIIAGVSKYAGDKMRRLEFGAKDAEDMTAAVRVFARSYFNGNVHVETLVSDEGSKRSPVTRANLQAAFQYVNDHATPDDVFLLFLSGHGLTTSSSSRRYFYFTADAQSVDDPSASSQSTVSADDLVAWLKDIPPTRRVILLDTCGAGGFVSQGIADQLQRNQNLFVLMGTAADKRSFESRFYQQSLLTYALLQGARGGARDVDGFIDAMGWIHFASLTVPDLLARDEFFRNYPVEQEPFISIPYYDERVILAKPTDADLSDIPLYVVRPQFVRPAIIDRDEGWDQFDLAGHMDKLFVASRGSSDIHAPEYLALAGNTLPGVLRPEGSYAVQNGRIFARVKLVRDHPRSSVGAEVAEDGDTIPELAEKLADAILIEIAKYYASPTVLP